MTTNLVTITDPTSPAAEAYRRLRVNLVASGQETPFHTLLIAAAGPDADKASTVANLAVTFARVGKRVILVDCDLRHPGQHTLFGLDNRAGVTTAVRAPLPPNAGGLSSPKDREARGPDSPQDREARGPDSPQDREARGPDSPQDREARGPDSPQDREARGPDSPQDREARGPDSPQDWGAGGAATLPLQATDVPGLRILTSGPEVEVPSDLIASPAMTSLIARLRDDADVVLFDAPPVVLATDAAELATLVDGVLLTVSAGHTRRDDAQRAVDLLGKVGARLVGAALVNAPADAELRKYLAA